MAKKEKNGLGLSKPLNITLTNCDIVLLNLQQLQSTATAGYETICPVVQLIRKQ